MTYVGAQQNVSFSSMIASFHFYKEDTKRSIGYFILNFLHSEQDHRLFVHKKVLQNNTPVKQKRARISERTLIYYCTLATLWCIEVAKRLNCSQGSTPYRRPHGRLRPSGVPFFRMELN